MTDIYLQNLSIILNIITSYINLLKTNIITATIVDSIMILAFISWSIFSLYYILGLFTYKMYKVLKGNKMVNAKIIIVTIGSKKVRDSVLYSIKHNNKYGDITVLTEEGADLLDELNKTNSTIIEIPKKYRNDLVGKGRALNYFAENIADDDTWYIFLDDDNLILDDSIFYEIDAYDKLGYVAANPILIPRIGGSKIAFIMDWLRYFDDIFVYRIFTGILSSPLVGLHGEMFTVKGKILKEIKYDKWTLTEDFRFSIELVKRGYKTWQSNTKVSILSPNSVSDLFRQRGRWFGGLIRDIRYATLKMKALAGLRIFAWLIGIFGSWAFFPLWFLFMPFWYAIIGGIMYWFIYIYGIKKLGEFRYIMLVPIFGILETATWMKGLWYNNFEVIDKNNKVLLKPRITK